MCKQTSAYGVKNDVIGLASLRKILQSIINNLIGSQGFHQFYIPGTEYPSDFRPSIPGRRYGRRNDGAKSAVDLLPECLLNKELQDHK